jgi:thioredoxin
MKRILAFALAIMACGALTLAGNGCAGGKDAGSGEVIQMDKAMFIKEVFDYTTETKEWKFKGDKPAIIDLYADWCGPCRMVAPIMKELAVEYKDSVVFYKVNVDQERELAAFFNATSIPLFVFIPVDGEPLLMRGAADKDTYVKAINDVLLKEEEKQ